MSLNIRDKQIAALKQMLNFNVPQPKGSFSEPVWKLLVYDRCGQDIISPLLSVKELRDMGITLHMLLHSDRDPIPEHKGSPFPTVAEAVQEELEAYRAQEDEVKKLKAAMGLEGDRTDEAITMLSDNTAKLTSAVSSLPELLERKRLIDCTPA
ncbi:hypothetical protein HPB49_014462 [Dermacentor silvarum]|uniref:Uncharacterized protein n=1 Tax=Dermacentor silvarum TaxID=543639 RepID=A0ACB8E106_DERSI|nr:hypothetical protein HPB49_014462 [Dermacentor silvarum]